LNAGDPDLSSQDNTLGLTDAPNEFILLAVWKNGSRTDKQNAPDELAFIVHELSGEEVYIQDIKLGIPEPITCSNWTLDSSVISGDSIIAVDNNTNETQYIAFEETHYLLRTYFDINESIFPILGSCNTTYDFGEGYTSSNVYSPTIAGDLNVNIKVQDCFGNEEICSKNVSVYYDIQTCFNTTPDVITNGTELSVQSCISGNTEQIIDVHYDINGDILNGENVTYNINEFGDVTITQYVTYYNGYQNVTEELTRTLNMENIPPEIDLEVISEPQENDTIKEYEFAHNGTDIDGYIEKVKWEIWRNNPDSEGNDNWSLYYTTTPITDLSNFTYDYTDIIGELKLVATVYDNEGASASQEYLIDNECETDVILCFENVDWTKRRKQINFDLNINKIEFQQRVIKIPWGINTIKQDFTVDIHRKDFQLVVNKINWKYKVYDVGTAGYL